MWPPLAGLVPTHVTSRHVPTLAGLTQSRSHFSSQYPPPVDLYVRTSGAAPGRGGSRRCADRNKIGEVHNYETYSSDVSTVSMRLASLAVASRRTSTHAESPLWSQ